MMGPRDRVFVSGRDTLIGAALVRALARRGFTNVIGREPDLTDAAAVDAFLAAEKPDYVLMGGGKSGGIEANQKYPADLMLHNLLLEANLIPAAYRHGVRKLLYLSSSCSYPRLAPQPMHPSSILAGPLEPTNEPYAVAKIAGIKLCQAFRRQYGANLIVGIAANPFGPGDSFHPEDGHVIPGLMRRFHEAREAGSPAVEIWGTGTPRREFIYADDLADACLFVMDRYEGEEPINLGGGTDVSIRELAELLKDIVGYPGELRFDGSRPDGMPLKSLDSTELLTMGWRAATPFRDALAATYAYYLERRGEWVHAA